MRIWSHEPTEKLINFSKSNSTYGENDFENQQILLTRLNSDENPEQMFELDQTMRNVWYKWFHHIFTFYDWRALLVITLNAFNRGARTVAAFSLGYLIHYEPYNLGPQYRSLVIALLFLPYMFAVPIALISSSVYICGNNDKSYIIIWAVI